MDLPKMPEKAARPELLSATFTRPSPGLLVVEVDGEVDTVTAPPLELKFSTAVGLQPDRLLINLDQVTFFSSAGITILLRLQEQCRDNGVGLWLVTPPQVHRVLDLVGLGQLFTMFSSRELAIGELSFT